MAALPTTGKISFLDIFNNINSNTVNPNSPFSIQDASEQMASASVVKDLDESGAMDVADRNLLYNKPYNITEFYEANFPSSIITGITLSTNQITGDPVSVDGEDVRITFTTDDTPGTYTVRLKDTSGNTDASDTRSGAGLVTFSNIALDADTYRPQVEFDIFNIVNDDSTFQHYDAVGSGTTGLSYTSTNVDAADEAVASLTITPTVGSGIQTSYTVAETVLEGGDGDDIDTNVSSNALANPTTVTVSNTPGKIRFTTTHRGGGGNYFVTGEPRNSTTSNRTLDIIYNNAIDSITQSQGNVNVSAVDGSNNVTFTCYSEGFIGTLYIGHDGNDTASDTDYANTTEAVSTLYVRESISKNLTIADAGTYYPKAHHYGNNAAVGSSFIVAPQLAFSTTGNDSISVGDTSHAFKATSPVGRNFSMTISANSAGSPSTTNYATGFTIAPGTVDGQYTITYNASADFSQTGPDQTDILYVYPDAAFSVLDTTLYINAPNGSGLSDDNLNISNTSVGDNISALLWTITKDGGGTVLTSSDPAISVTSGTLKGASWGAGTYNVSLRVTGGGSLQNTETGDDNFTITNHPTQQLTIDTPVSVHIARRGTSTAITWTKRSAAAVTIVSYKASSAIDTISSGNTGTSTSWTPDGGDSLGTDWRIYGSVDSGTATDYSAYFALRDGIAIAPSTPSDSSGNETAGISWSDGSYNGGGNKVYTYSDSGGSSQTAVSSTIAGTSYTYSESRTSTTVTRYFRVSGINLSGEEGDKSGVSNGANIYPILSEEFASGDISFSVDPVEVGVATELRIANVADNIVGYTWAESGDGGMSVTSGTASTGDRDGTSDDGTGLIDESNITVTFDTAEEDKTISLTLYGRNSQTVTRTKDIDVELVDALTISGISNTNGTNSVTVSGNQSGFAGGVTAGLATNASSTSFITSTEETTNPDSRFTLRSYSESFTPADQVTTQHLVGRVEVDGESDALNTSAFYYYPQLKAGRNQITPSSATITTAGSVSFTTPQTATDNVTKYVYTTAESITNGTQGDGSSVISHATAVFTSNVVGVRTVTLVVSGLSGQNDVAGGTASITVNYAPEVTSVVVTPTTKYTGTTIYVRTYFQGFGLTTGIEYIDHKLFNSGGTLQSTQRVYGNIIGAGSAGESANYYHTWGTIGSGGDYYFTSVCYDEQNDASYSESSAQFTIASTTQHDLNGQSILVGTAVLGYDSLIDAADTTITTDYTQRDAARQTWASTGTLADGVRLYTDSGLGSAFNGNTKYFSRLGNVFQIEDNGDIDELRSRTPNTLATPTLSVDGETDIDLTVPSSNTIVARSIRVHSSVAIGGSQTATWTVTQSTGYTTTKSMAAIFGADLAHTTAYTFKVQGYNNDLYFGTYSGTATATTDTPVANPTVSIAGTGAYWNAGTNTYARSTGIDGYNLETTTFTVTSANRGGNIVRLQVAGTNDGYFKWRDDTFDGGWGTGFVYIGSGTAEESTMADNNTNYFRISREMNSGGDDSPDLTLRCRVIKGGTSYYSDTITINFDLIVF